jgi:hypothetical protein
MEFKEIFFEGFFLQFMGKVKGLSCSLGGRIIKSAVVLQEKSASSRKAAKNAEEKLKYR